MRGKTEVIRDFSLFLLVFTILFTAIFAINSFPVSAQTDVNGCCCELSSGNAQQPPAYRLQTECTSPFLDFIIPSFQDIVNGKSCTDLCAENIVPPTSNVTLPPPPPISRSEFCGTPGFYPSPANLSAKPIKGEKFMRLEWTERCQADAYLISRCEGTTCTNFNQIAVLSGTYFFKDQDSSLKFSQDYNYEVIAVYGVDESNPSNTTGNLGDIECWKQFSNNLLCISDLYYSNFKSYFQLTGYNNRPATEFQSSFTTAVTAEFFDKFSRPASCNDLNQIILTDTACPSGEMCFIEQDPASPQGIASCIANTPCNTFSSALGFGVTEEQCEGTAGSKNYCFLDKSVGIVDKCYDCDPRQTCYDYKSKNSCQKDNCNVQDCAWKDTYPSLGLGVCVDTQVSNCHLCNLQGSEFSPTFDVYNLVFDQCSKEKAEAMSTDYKPCFWKDWKATGCEGITCSDYTVNQCGSSGTGIQLAQDNSIIPNSKSSDACSINVCQYDALTGCRKNADGTDKSQNWPDCEKGDSVCEADYFPPKTTIIPAGEQGRYDYLNIRIKDKVNYSDSGSIIAYTQTVNTSGTNLANRIEYSDYRVYLCLETPTISCNSKNDFTTSINSTQLNLNDLALQDGDKVLFDLSFGKNVLKYYAVDKYKNQEVINSINIFACENCQGPKLSNVFVQGALEVDGNFYTRIAKPRIDITLNELAEITASRLSTPSLSEILLNINPDPSLGLAKDFSLTPTQALEEGENLLDFNARDTNLVFMQSAGRVPIFYDITPPTVTIKPGEFEIQGNDTVDIIIEFDEPIANNYRFELLEEVIVNGVLVIDSRDITNITKTGDNIVFRVSITMNDGKKTIVVNAQDYAGNKMNGEGSFTVRTGPPQIFIKKPSFGYSSTYSFDLEFGTTWTAECKYWTSQSLPPAPFSSLISFDSTNSISHKSANFAGISEENKAFKIYVECIDPEFGSSSDVFDFYVDTTAPSILSAFAQPATIVERPLTTTLKIATDDKTRCRYQEGLYSVVLDSQINSQGGNSSSNSSQSSSSSTIGFYDLKNEFPGFDRRGKRVNVKNISVDEIKAYQYTVACMNLAELGPASSPITFNVDLTRAFSIKNVGPTLFNSTSVYLAIESNKNSFCYYDKGEGFKAFELDQIETKAHNVNFQVPGQGQYNISIRCVTGAKTSLGGPEETTTKLQVFVDTSPPEMVFVDDSSSLLNNTEVAYFLNQLRVAYLGADSQTKISRYFYSVENLYTLDLLQNWTPSSTLTGLPHYITGLNLIDGESYSIKVKAENAVGLLSNELASDGVTIDSSLKPLQCENLVLDANETDVDCGGICPQCGEGQNCKMDVDCDSGFCDATNLVCKAPACDDNKKNGDETGVDCGGSCNTKCPNQETCLLDLDCESSHCINGFCGIPDVCENSELDGEETDIDCGGACVKCGEGKSCDSNTDCSGELKCVLNTCSDCKEGDNDCDGTIDDLDGDGILNENDKCPNTPKQESADDEGCANSQKDTDEDGMNDACELKYDLDINDPSDAKLDPDNDGLTNAQECVYDTDPHNKDTDGDSWKDGKEVNKGTDPTDPYDYPKAVWPIVLLIIILLIGIVLGAVFGRKYIKQIMDKKKFSLKNMGLKPSKKIPIPITKAKLKHPTQPKESKLKGDDWVPLVNLSNHIGEEHAGSGLFAKLEKLRKGKLPATEHESPLKEVKNKKKTKEVFNSLKDLHLKSLDKKDKSSTKQKEPESKLFKSLKNLGDKKELPKSNKNETDKNKSKDALKLLREKNKTTKGTKKDVFKNLEKLADKDELKNKKKKHKTKKNKN